MYINYFRLCNISGGLHHDNPFASAANLPPTGSKSAMFFASALIRERNLQMHRDLPYAGGGGGGGEGTVLICCC